MSRLRVLRIRMAVRSGAFPESSLPVLIIECRSGKCGRCHKCKPQDSIPVAFQPRGEA